MYNKNHHLEKVVYFYQMGDVFFGLYNLSPPPRPKTPFIHVVYAYRDISLSKGHLGSRWGGGKHLKQTERHQFYLPNDKRHGFKCISYALAEGIR